MIFLLIILFLTDIAYKTNGNAGSTLFNNRCLRAECWNEEDIEKLRARKAFEDLLPEPVRPDEINGQYIKEMVRYFRRTLRSAQQATDPRIAVLLKDAIADTIGAHLRNEILPTVRFAFYAGYVPYRNARQVHDLFDNVKGLLNTQGIGWKQPPRLPRWSNLTVAKILIGAVSIMDPCTCLVTKRDSDSCIHLPIPKLDDNLDPSAIALPFKTGGLVSLTSPSSNNALLKYYTNAARCILNSSPEKCRHTDFLSFNNELWNWMKRDVAPHLIDEKLYAAYGGVLRIAASVQTYGKGLSRRNLFETEYVYDSSWNPWKAITRSFIYIDADWTPKLYILLVIVIALIIFLVQMIMNYLCGHSCRCRGTPDFAPENGVAYETMQSNTPLIQPHQSAVYCSNKRRIKRSISKTRSASLGSVRTQKVYDLNENTEKLMAVIMSGNEDTASDTSVSSDSEEVHRPTSPPKIETSISEIKIERRVDIPQQSPISTSTVTREQHVSDSVWSESESTTQSVTSTSSKSNKSRSSRDLVWARRVISKHSGRSISKSNSTSKTEVDLNSFTTPPS